MKVSNAGSEDDLNLSRRRRLEEVLQGPAIQLKRPFQHLLRLVRRQPVGLEACRPRHLTLPRAQLIHGHGGQAVTKGRVAQQGVAQTLGCIVERFQALDDAAAVGVSERALRTDPLASTVQSVTPARYRLAAPKSLITCQIASVAGGTKYVGTHLNIQYILGFVVRQIGKLPYKCRILKSPPRGIMKALWSLSPGNETPQDTGR